MEGGVFELNNGLKKDTIETVCKLCNGLLRRWRFKV